MPFEFLLVDVCAPIDRTMPYWIGGAHLHVVVFPSQLQHPIHFHSRFYVLTGDGAFQFIDPAFAFANCVWVPVRNVNLNKQGTEHTSHIMLGTYIRHPRGLIIV